jgi:DNA-binding CsgD family transcriptional regulator
MLLGRQPPRRLFLGRHDEVERVLRAVESGSAVIVGAPSIGKTSLAEHVLDRLGSTRPPRTVVRLRATAAEAATPMATLAPLLGDLAMRDGDAIGSLAAQIAARLVQPAQSIPVVFVDDAHCLDPVSVHIVEALIQSGAIRVLLTCRTSPGLPSELARLWKEGHLERLDLAGLPRDVIVDFVEQLCAPALVTPSTAERIADLADGSPFFARELTRSLQAAGDLRERSGVLAWADERLPASLHDAINDELADLDPVSLDCLRLIAFSEPVRPGHLERLVPAEPVDLLLQQGLLAVDRLGDARTAEPMLRLAHPLYSEALRASVTPMARRALLRRLSAAYDNVGPRSRPTEVVQRAVWAAEIGQQLDPALMLQAHRIAVSLQDHGFIVVTATALIEDLQSTPGTRLIGLTDRGTAYRLTGQHRPAEADFTTAARLASTERERLRDEPEALVHHTLMMVDVLLFQRGEPQRAMQVIDETSAWLGDLHPPGTRLLELTRANRRAFAGEVRESLQSIERLVEAGLEPGEYLPLVPSHAIGLVQRNRAERARQVAREGLALADSMRHEHPWATNSVTSTLFIVEMLGGWIDESVETLSWIKARMAHTSLRHVHDPAMLGCADGYLALAHGDWEEATRQLRQVVMQCEIGDPSGFAAYHLAHLALALAARGQTAECAEVIAQARRTPLRGSRMVEADYRLLLALAAFWLGERGVAEQAGELAQWCRERDLHLGELRALHLQLVATMEVGAEFDAQAWSRLTTLAGESDAPIAGAIRDHCAELATGRRQVGTAADRRLRRHGMHLPDRVIASTLTARELDVARLAALGFSNKQIAERFGISVRTVETHVSRILVKLAVGSRADLDKALAALAPDAGASRSAGGQAPTGPIPYAAAQ